MQGQTYPAGIRAGLHLSGSPTGRDPSVRGSLLPAVHWYSSFTPEGRDKIFRFLAHLLDLILGKNILLLLTHYNWAIGYLFIA